MKYNEIIKKYAQAQNTLDEKKLPPLPCPRCGYMYMRRKLVENALSRHADIYICTNCGTDEAIRDFMENKLDIADWYICKYKDS